MYAALRAGEVGEVSVFEVLQGWFPIQTIPYINGPQFINDSSSNFTCFQWQVVSFQKGFFGFNDHSFAKCLVPNDVLSITRLFPQPADAWCQVPFTT